MLRSIKSDFGTQKFELDLEKLYPDQEQMGALLGRWDEFSSIDPILPDICCIEKGKLIYLTESFVSDQVDPRPPLL